MKFTLSGMYIIFKRRFHTYILQHLGAYYLAGLICVILITLYQIKFSIYKPYTLPKEPVYMDHLTKFKYRKLLRQNLTTNNDILLENTSLKYILLWNPRDNPFHRIRDRGRAPFILNNCQHTNCYLTHTRNFFPDQTNFDAVLFSVESFVNKIELPENRSSKQKFVVAATQPAPNPIFDNYFNWTWTYRLDSDVLWRYITIYDKDGFEVGPSKNMVWLEYFEPTSDHVKKKLRRKTKAAAWIAPDLMTKLKLEKHVNAITEALKGYGFTVDVSIGNSCGNESSCNKMIEDDYYFYLVIENYFDKDYVTERVLTAVHNYAIPIVFGAADYSRFLPPKSYLNARDLDSEKLVQNMIDIIDNFTLHDEYFRWTNHYAYGKAGNAEICNICKSINDENLVNKNFTYSNFREWWQGTMTIREMILSIYLKDKDFRRAGNDYRKVKRLFKRKYFVTWPSTTFKVSVFVYNMSKLVTTTDSNTVDANISDTTATDIMNDD